MSDEEAETNDDGSRYFVVRKLIWRHEDLDDFINQVDKKRKNCAANSYYPRKAGPPSKRMPSPQCPPRYIGDQYIPEYNADM